MPIHLVAKVTVVLDVSTPARDLYIIFLRILHAVKKVLESRKDLSVVRTRAYSNICIRV